MANKAEKAKKVKQSKYLVKQNNKKEKLKKCKTSKDKEKQNKKYSKNFDILSDSSETDSKNMETDDDQKIKW